MKLVLFSVILIALYGCQSIDDVNVKQQNLVTSSKSTTIYAPINRIWKVLTNVNGWTKWHSDISDATLIGTFSEHQEFLWKASGIKIKSKVLSIEQDKELTWAGIAFGTNVVHKWSFEQIEDNKVLVTSTEYMNGWLPNLFTDMMTEKLIISQNKWLELLKKVSENKGQVAAY